MVTLYHAKAFFPCTRFPPTFQKLFQNFSVRVPLRFQEFFKSKFFESFSKSRVYVYSYPKKTFLKVSFLKESLSENVYVYLGEQMFEKSNKISDRLFYYIINPYILLRESVLISFLRQSVLTLNKCILKKLFSRKFFSKSKERTFSKVKKMAGKVNNTLV